MATLKIRSAKLVLLNGLGLEAADIQRAVKQSKVSYAEATKGIQPSKPKKKADTITTTIMTTKDTTTTTANMTPTSGTTLFLCPTMPKTSLKP